jgi:hypothetical protein
MALATVAPTAWRDVRLFGVGVASRAMRQQLEVRDRPTPVLGVGNRLKMSGITASTVAAKMVEL